LLGLIGVVIATIILNNGVGVGSNAPVYIITFIIFYKHIPNIIRLFNGQEAKVA
jgi:glycerol-3-phosphate acyltransferase PlsY